MKIVLSIIIGLFFSFALYGQQPEIPRKVIDEFTKLYPNATDVKWSMEGEEEFEVSFMDAQTKISVVFEDDGEVLETETVIDPSVLPISIHEYISKNYENYDITEAAKIVDEDGILTFEAEVTKGNDKKDLLFDSNGVPQKKEVKKESEEEKEDEKD